MTSAATALGTLPPANPVPLRQDAAVIGLVGLAHGTSHFSHMLLAPLFPVFIRDFGLGFADVGLLMTVFFIISGVGQALSGFLVDRVGARPVLFAAIGCFLLASLVASQATGYWGLMATAVLAGLGNAPFHPCDFTILNQRVSTARLGHAFSVHGVTGSLGWALAPVFLVGITSLSDWRTAYYSAALLYTGVLALLWWQRDKLRTEVVVRTPAAHAAGPHDLAFLKLPVVWWCFAFFLLSTMTLAVVQSFVPSILQALYGTSMEAATLTVSAYMLCSAFGMFVGGFVTVYGQRHQISSDTVLAWGMGLGALLMLLCATGWFGEFGTMAVLAITGFALGVAGPSRDMLIKRATPKGATGRVDGTVYSGLDVGFALAPLMFGVLMDHGWYAATRAGGAVVLALSAYAALGVGKRVATA